MNLLEPISKKSIIFWLAVAAAFLLILREGQPVKWADLLFAIIGILVLINRRARSWIAGLWPHAKAYVLPILFLVIFVGIGQLAGFLSYGPAPVSIKEIATNYGRLVLVGGIFMLLALLISASPRLIHYLSVAIFVSPLVIVPVFWGAWQNILLENGRLAGFLQNPIILGYWLVVIFLIGIGLFLSSKKSWQKIVVVSWLVVVANFILWSASRAAWSSLAISLIVWSALYFKKGNFKKCWTLVVITIPVFYLGYMLFRLGQPPAPAVQSFVAARAVKFVTHPLSDQIRPKFWLEASRLAIQNPLGIGFGYYPRKNIQGETLQPFNTFLEIAVYGGAGALTIFILILSRLGASIKLALRELSGAGAELKLAWFVAVPAVLIDIFFADSIFFRHIWVVLGVALGLSWQARLKNF